MKLEDKLLTGFGGIGITGTVTLATSMYNLLFNYQNLTPFGVELTQMSIGAGAFATTVGALGYGASSLLKNYKTQRNEKKYSQNPKKYNSNS